MNYTIDHSHYKNFKDYNINKLAPRAYFIPFSEENAAANADILTERESSDKIIFLSGEWKFAYYPRVSKMPASIDTANLPDTVAVPSTWQRTGYEPPVYLNSRYPFKVKPPKIPTDIPVSVYAREFEIGEKSGRYILTFLGVIPCIDVYVNGEFVGYSEGAHNTAEFDIGKYLHSGVNELVAVVHKCSNATYLECQDMFRENGIFRDVYICALEDTHIYDYEVRTAKTASGYKLSGKAEIFGSAAGYSVEAKLLDRESGECVAFEEFAAESAEFSFYIEGAKEWSAEIPNLYELRLILKKDGECREALRSFVGFRRIEIDGEVFLFNGQKIKLKGVNHHDTTPHGGYVMTARELLLDVKLMKQFNVNAVRTSHYPPDPLFLTLCDLYGLYVVDEADIETHGCYAVTYRPNRISNKKKWAGHYLERVRFMYMRDRNHPSITMWSLGNESGGWKNHDRCYKMLKDFGTDIPVHYEGVCRTPRLAYDVYSEMYTSVEAMAKIRARGKGNPHNGKPFFLCEYAHAMGEGPGGLTDYADMFYSDDKFMGGCIWEWADHAVLHAEEGAKFRYTYGGDHGEEIHDGNFCVDGLFYPDRRPHTGAHLMKYAYRPLRAEKSGDGYKFTNTNRFRSSEYITIVWELAENGVPCEKGELKLNIPPCGSETVKIAHGEITSQSDWQMNFTYFADEEEIAAEQIILMQGSKKAEESASDEKPAVEERGGKTAVVFADGEAVFDKASGRLTSYNVLGREMLAETPAAGEAGFLPNLYRAYIDNDRCIVGSWDKCGLKEIKFSCESFEVAGDADSITVMTVQSISSGNKNLGKAAVAYDIGADGKIKITSNLSAGAAMCNELARFGIIAELAGDLRNVEYYGLGEKENLPDFCGQSRLGVYKARVEDMHEPYIRPQDNGNHGETAYLHLTDENGAGISVTGEKKFSFSVHEYTQALLTRAEHIEELHDEGTVTLSIDGFMRGAGSGSCGPAPDDEYIIKKNQDLEFTVTLAPYKA